MVRTQSKYDFSHWLAHQWVQYVGNGSLLDSPHKQRYVMRYEDLKMDPFGTMVNFLETTVRARLPSQAIAGALCTH